MSEVDDLNGMVLDTAHLCELLVVISEEIMRLDEMKNADVSTIVGRLSALNSIATDMAMRLYDGIEAHANAAEKATMADKRRSAH